MTSRELTIACFALVLAVAATLEVLARAGWLALPTLDETFAAARRRSVGKVITFIVWFWFGWHFLARGI
jgi:Family of unknown function (DUF6186)